MRCPQLTLNDVHLVAPRRHQGQRPDFLPKNRGFDAFYGLPYSVDDGVGYANASACGIPAPLCSSPPRWGHCRRQ